jgi:hypothetical protein
MFSCLLGLLFSGVATFLLAVACELKWLMWWCLISAWHVGNLPLSCYSILVMSPSRNDDDVKSAPPDKTTVILLLLTIGDTTWRMFIPTIGMTLLGLFADKWLHTTPWIMVVAMAIGIGITVVLVKNQMKRVQK